MVKMVSLKKSAADKRAEKDALGTRDIPSVPAENEGISVNLDHHHLTKMGVGGGLKAGHKVELHGAGVVEHAESRNEGGEVRHSARLRLHKAGMDYEGSDEDKREDLRQEITKNAEKGSDGDKSPKGKFGKPA